MSCGLGVVGAAPLLAASPVPLQDWPNHVAGAHVLAALRDGDSFWSGFYRFNTFLVPNAAVDLGLLGLRHAGVTEPLAATLFLLFTYVVFVAGLVALSGALGQGGPAPVAAAVLLFYGTALFWGLVNYILAIGMMWGLLAAWLAAAGHPARRVGLAGGGAALLLFVHVIPAVVFGLLLACFDVARWWAGGRLRDGLSAPVALVVAVGVLRLLPGATGHDLVMGYAGDGLAGFAAHKATVFATSLFGGSRLMDGATLLAVAGGGLAVGLAARVRIAPGAGLAIAALIGLALAAPERLGTGSLLDLRLAILPVMLAAASCQLAWRSAAAARLCVVGLALLVVLRTAVIAVEWRAAAAVFAAFDAEAAALPRGGMMVMAYGRPLDSLSWTDIWAPPIQSLATQVVARGMFFPALFANPDQQPIVLREPFRDLGQPWDFSGPARRRASLAALRPLCADRRYAGVFVTVLYGDAPFRIVDACAPAPATAR